MIICARWCLPLLFLVGCASTPDGRVQPEMSPSQSKIARAASADDPTVTDPVNYQAVMENEFVRVLRYHDTPKTKTHLHRHPDSVLFAISSFSRRLIFADGTTRERTFKVGDVMWIPAQVHAGENIGETDTEVLLVEVKSSQR